jgi:hypothetical protein
MIAGLVASQRFLEKTLKPGTIKERAKHAETLFRKEVEERFAFICADGLQEGMMRAVHPAAGWHWRYSKLDLEEYFSKQNTHVLVLDMGEGHLWVRVSFAYFLDGHELKEFCRSLRGAVEHD